MVKHELDDKDRTPCEIYTRVMGYHRPTSAFNPAKQQEHADRVCYEEARVPDLTEAAP